LVLVAINHVEDVRMDDKDLKIRKLTALVETLCVEAANAYRDGFEHACGNMVDPDIGPDGEDGWWAVGYAQRAGYSNAPVPSEDEWTGWINEDEDF
jgi:hypothetical protein